MPAGRHGADATLRQARAGIGTEEALNRPGGAIQPGCPQGSCGTTSTWSREGFASPAAPSSGWCVSSGWKAWSAASRSEPRSADKAAPCALDAVGLRDLGGVLLPRLRHRRLARRIVGRRVRHARMGRLGQQSSPAQPIGNFPPAEAEAADYAATEPSAMAA